MERVAFLTLDNLSGDPSLSWIGDAVPSAAMAQLAGVGGMVPVRGDTSREAAASAATRLIHGYFDIRRKALHFEFSIENAATHTMQPLALDGDPLHAADAIAKAMDPSARAFGTASPAAMEAWGKRDFQKATQLDPDFGAAWRELIRASQPEQALELAGKAVSRASLRGPVEQAQISLLAAQLRRDDDAVGKASLQLATLVPNDAELLRRMAEEASNSRRFALSVEFYRRLIRIQGGDSGVYNQLGYAQFFAGDLAGARKSFDEYSKDPGQEANASDSQGEVLFMAGQFREAEQYFQKAHATNPAMLDGGDLLKAAYARWLAGDLKGADSIFDGYIRYRSEHADQTVGWRHAAWEYTTGRETLALDRLKKESGPAAAMAQAQLQVFANRDKVIQGLTKDLTALGQKYARTAPASDGAVRVLYAKGLLDAGRKTDAEKLMALWPLPESGDPALQPLIYPLYLELKKALGK
jgi:tetratricopeptide (TPR) repeat protein